MFSHGDLPPDFSPSSRYLNLEFICFVEIWRRFETRGHVHASIFVCRISGTIGHSEVVILYESSLCDMGDSNGRVEGVYRIVRPSGGICHLRLPRLQAGSSALCNPTCHWFCPWRSAGVLWLPEIYYLYMIQPSWYYG